MVKRITALFMVVVIVTCSCLIPVQAATCSWGTMTRIITVTTKPKSITSPSITLKQTKGTYTYVKKGKNKSGKDYYWWNVSVRSTDGKHSFKKNFKDGSIKLSLKKNKTYRITVSLNGYQESIQSVKYHAKYNSWRWKTQPQWNVSKTKNISNYY